MFGGKSCYHGHYRLKAEITNNLNDNIGDDFYLKKKFFIKEWNSIPSTMRYNESVNPSIIHLAGIIILKELKF